MRAILVGVVGFIVGCGGPKAPAPGGGPGVTVRSSASASASASATPTGGVGDGCDPKAERTTCGESLHCVPAPGGYCTKFCSDAPCGAGSACVPTGRLGEWCAKSCASDADCRQGYTCDPRWSVCTLPRLSSPRLATCGAPTLARKTFGAPVRVTSASSPGRYNFEPSAALTKAGEVAIAFMIGVPHGSAYGVATTVVRADGTVEPARVFAGGKDTHFDPWLAGSKDRKLALVWLGFEGNTAPEKNAEIGFATSDDGRAWSPPRRADDKDHDCKGQLGCYDKPMVVFGPDKERPGKEALYVLYLTDTGGGLKLVKSIDGGATFGESRMIRDDAGFGSVDVSTSGGIHAAYTHADGKIDLFGDAKNQVEYARSDDGGKTFVHDVVSAEGQAIPMFFSNPQVVRDDARKLVYVVYPAGGADGVWDIWLATSRDDGRTWTRRRVNDDTTCANHAAPQAALDATTGRVHVTWLENRTGQGGLAYARCEPGGARCSPNESVSDAPFASYVLTRHSPKWMGEYGALLVDPRTRNLHAVWTQTVAEPGQPSATARIFHASGKLD